VELKTFTRDGRIVLTSGKLQEAAASGDACYLVALLDEGGPAEQQIDYLIRNPSNALLISGQLDIEATLQAAAATIFNFRSEDLSQERAVCPQRKLVNLECERFVDQLLQPLHIGSAAGSARIVGPSVDIFLGPSIVH
jgi:hypothetical protein